MDSGWILPDSGGFLEIFVDSGRCSLILNGFWLICMEYNGFALEISWIFVAFCKHWMDFCRF